MSMTGLKPFLWAVAAGFAAQWAYSAYLRYSTKPAA
jgi:hypothetical protein